MKVSPKPVDFGPTLSCLLFTIRPIQSMPPFSYLAHHTFDFKF